MENETASTLEGLTPARLSALGLDVSGLSVRAYEAKDYAVVSEWWKQRHSHMIGAALLPPLGVVVEDTFGPAGVLFCYECYGVGMAFLEHPCTRPGLMLSEASAVMAMAVVGCCALAGKGVDPPAVIKLFRVAAPPSTARFLRRIGFESSDSRPLRGMILHNI